MNDKSQNTSGTVQLGFGAVSQSAGATPQSETAYQYSVRLLTGDMSDQEFVTSIHQRVDAIRNQ